LEAWSGNRVAQRVFPCLKSRETSPEPERYALAVSEEFSSKFEIIRGIGSILRSMLWQSATIVASIANWPAISEAADRMVIYGMPPVILLFRLGMQKYSMIGCVAVTLHTIAMAVLYAIVGIVILTHREYVRKRE
jgi:hypothetical protein